MKIAKLLGIKLKLRTYLSNEIYSRVIKTYKQIGLQIVECD